MTKVVPKVNQGGLVLAEDAAALLHRLQWGRDVFCVFVGESEEYILWFGWKVFRYLPKAWLNFYSDLI